MKEGNYQELYFPQLSSRNFKYKYQNFENVEDTLILTLETTYFRGRDESLDKQIEEFIKEAEVIVITAHEKFSFNYCQ